MKSNLSLSNLFAALASFVVLASAGQSGAVVTINHSTTGNTTLNVGDTIAVQVRISWDGAGALQGVFSSTAADNVNVLNAISAVNGANFYRGSIFAFTDPDTGDATSLGRFGQNQLRQDVDPLNVVRSVQYGSLTPIQAGGAASNVLVTTITFQAVGPGTTTIGSFLAPADTGSQGDTDAAGTTVTVTVPEPGQIALGLVALASVAGVAGLRRKL